MNRLCRIAAKTAGAFLAIVPSAAALPNLTPYQPPGWSDKIVVSKTTGTTTDSSLLYTTDTLSVDWAIINNGSSATASTFYTALYVDGIFQTDWYSAPPVNANAWQYIKDYSIGSLSAGTHTVKIKTDSTGVIAESNEADNEYTKSINVTLPNTNPLQNGTQVNNLSGAQGGQSFYKITVPAGQGRLDISTASGTGDCDLYVNLGSLPTLSTYSYSSTGSGSTERVTIYNPAAGDWYILLSAYSAYSGVTLVAGYGSADLAKAAASISRTAVAAGQSITVSLSVVNQGSAASDATQIYFYFRSNPNDYRSGAWVGQISLAGLDAGATATGLQFTYALSLNTPAGTYALSYWIDGPGSVTESDESNNTGTWTGIAVSSAPVQQFANNVPLGGQSGTEGSQSLYKITVPAGQGRLDISTAGGTGDCDLYVKFGSPPTLSSYGYSSTGSGNNEAVTIYNPSAGDWYVLLYGYSAYSGLTVTAGYGTADLTKAAESISRTAVAAGQSITVTLSVVNRGGAASDPTQIYFYFRSNPNDYSSGAWVGQINLAGLNAGATATGLQFTYVLPLNTPAGTYALSYWIDAPGSVAESDESNNTGTWTGIAVSSAPVQALANNVPVNGQSGAQGSQKLYKITVPAGQGRLDIRTAGGTGDCDLYVKFGSPPTLSSYSYSSTGSGSTEGVTVNNPAAGDWYVLLYGYTAYSGAALTAGYDVIRTITFDEFSVGTFVQNQYSSLGVVFSGNGAGPFIVQDDSTPTSPALSGSPQFFGSITVRFVEPTSPTIRTVATRVSFDAGYFDNVGSTVITWFDANSAILGAIANTQLGIQHIVIPGSIGGFSIATNRNEQAGFAIDNLCFAISNGENVSTSNVRASQRLGTTLVDFFYDLQGTGLGYTASVTVSTDGGAMFTVPATHFTGDGVSSPVAPGTGRHIVWDAGADLGAGYFPNVVVRLSAGGSSASSGVFAVDLNRPRLLAQPVNQTVQAGAVAQFTVAAAGPAPLNYQWRFNGQNITGATGSTLPLNSVTAAASGVYSVVVWNAYGSVASDAASLAVLADGANGSQPAQITASDVIVQVPGKTKLVIVTHGWLKLFKDAPVLPPWVTPLANAIQSEVPADWEVVADDWALDAWTLKPDQALQAGTIRGGLLGKHIAAQSWQHVHLIGHSAGAALIQAAADAIRQTKRGVSIQTTFLDPYLGFDYHGRTWYGENADWSDSYFAHDWPTDVFPTWLGYPPSLTEGPLQMAYAVDVTWVDPARTLTPIYCPGITADSTPQTCGFEAWSSHEWPHEFYLGTIPGADPSILGDNAVCAAGYGFALSKEIEGDTWDNQASHRVGLDPEVPCGPTPFSQNPYPLITGQPFRLDLLPNATSASGVSVFGSGATLSGIFSPPGPQAGTGEGGHVLKDGPPVSTNAPPWLAVALSVTNVVNFVTFDAGFNGTNGGQGLMTVYWNTNAIGMVDERVAPPGQETYRFALPGNVATGLYTLSFRLDVFTNVVSSITVTNVATGFVGVSEPLTLEMLLWGSNSVPVLKLTGATGYNYVLESSTNLLNWAPAALLVNTNGTVLFADPAMTNSSGRFYRAVLQ